MWSEEKVERLIELYKQHPILWDNKHKGYRTREEKTEALKIISQEIQVDIREVERKINILLTQFRRTRKKILAMQRAGQETDAERSTWYGYKLMQFLEDKYPEAKMQAKQEFVSWEDLNETEDTQDFDPNYEESITKSPEIEEESQTPKRQLSMEEVDLPPAKRRAEEDEYNLFGELIAMKLRKIDPILRVETQHKINCILYEAEMRMLSRE